MTKVPKPSQPIEQAWQFVWKKHGRGLSTAVGIQTRRLLVEAWIAGYRAGRRSKS